MTERQVFAPPQLRQSQRTLAQRLKNDGGALADVQAVIAQAFPGLTPDQNVLAFDRRQRYTFQKTFEQYVATRVGAGRIKNQAHWQSDVLAGWAVGGLSGWYAHSRDAPILVEILPHGAAVGWHKQF